MAAFSDGGPSRWSDGPLGTLLDMLLVMYPLVNIQKAIENGDL